MKEDEKAVVECIRRSRDYQIAKFGRVLPNISGYCFHGCPVSLVKPNYPREAKRLGISGLVKVETIVDENGKIIYAKTLKGSSFLSRVAEQAAYLSRYMPEKACDKPIKFRWTIIYNFVLSR